MNNETLFYTQLGSIVAYIIIVFFLYRLLVGQKEATIELLKEKNNYLETRLEDLKEKSPGILEERLSKRVNMLENELGKLSEDEMHNKEKIKEKEKELQIEEEKLEKLRNKTKEFKELVSEYFCSDCGAPSAYHQFAVGNENVVHKIIKYKCGKQIIDDRVKIKCSKIQENI